MKNIRIILAFIGLILVSGCEKVVDIDLNTMEPKLVIDAAIKWQKGTVGNVQTIKLSTTNSYYDNQIPTVSGATVFITDANNNVFNFVESNVAGSYVCSNFTPVLNRNYTLTVNSNGSTYTATETLKPVPQIDRIEQINNTGFTGNVIEIKTYFTDNGTTQDYYLFKFKPTYTAIPIYFAQEDISFQGNQIFGLYRNDKLEPGQNFEVTLSGISRQYYNYMRILISIAGNNSGGSPFQSPAATVRGNIINTTNDANYPLGYFSLSEEDYRNYIVN
jgi:hypothetical protein